MDVAAVDVDDPPEEILAYVREQRHSRLPVYADSIDNVIGILQIRKYIKACIKNGGKAVDVRPLLDEPVFVHQSTLIAEVLPELSRRKANLAIVTDNYGGTLGIVTVEDIVEELVGEIWDEDDVVEESFVPLGGGRYEVDARDDRRRGVRPGSTTPTLRMTRNCSISCSASGRMSSFPTSRASGRASAITGSTCALPT